MPSGSIRRTKSDGRPEWVQHFASSSGRTTFSHYGKSRGGVVHTKLTWGTGVYEQNVLPLLRGLNAPTHKLGVLPGSDMFMARRHVAASTPPSPINEYLAADHFTNTPIRRIGARRNRHGLRQWQVTPGMKIDYSKLGPSPAEGSPEYQRCRPIYAEPQSPWPSVCWRSSQVPVGMDEGSAPAAPEFAAATR